MAPARWQLIWGAEVACMDGSPGVLTRLIVDPATRRATHLVVEPRHLFGIGRLVPIGWVQSVHGLIDLACTRADFEGFQRADDRSVASASVGASAAWTDHLVPDGALEIVRDETVQGRDGHVGRVDGVVVEPNSGEITLLVLAIAHFPHARQVVVPFDQLDFSDEFGMHLRLSTNSIRAAAALQPPTA